MVGSILVEHLRNSGASEKCILLLKKTVPWVCTNWIRVVHEEHDAMEGEQLQGEEGREVRGAPENLAEMISWTPGRSGSWWRGWRPGLLPSWEQRRTCKLQLSPSGSRSQLQRQSARPPRQRRCRWILHWPKRWGFEWNPSQVPHVGWGTWLVEPLLQSFQSLRWLPQVRPLMRTCLEMKQGI